MIEIFRSGGIVMWPMLLIALGIIVLAVQAGMLVGTSRGEELRSKRDAILFWGGMSLLLGVLGTVVGWVMMARAVQLAGGANEGLVWGGFGVSLVSLVFGLLVLVLAALVWFALTHLSRRALSSMELRSG